MFLGTCSCMNGWVGGWKMGRVNGQREVKAIEKIAYINQKGLKHLNNKLNTIWLAFIFDFIGNI